LPSAVCSCRRVIAWARRAHGRALVFRAHSTIVDANRTRAGV
jgi:hypothetical protein